MKRIVAVLSMTVGVLLVFQGSADAWLADAQRLSAQGIANGQHIFVQSCASCHDARGTANKTGPGLKNYYRQHQPRPTDAAVRLVIQHGKGAMPAFSSLTKSQTDDLLAYIKTL